MKRLFPVITLVFLTTASLAPACTTFVLEGGGRIYFGRNLDWDWQNGMVLVNQRNVRKTALVVPGHPAAQWTSKYGSVTFNQFGQELPFGGMNEAGLVVENMWLGNTVYPAPDQRPEINMLQWIQYQLDTCRTVAEVISNDAKIRLEPPNLPAWVHYLVTDATGDTATIEFLNGRMVCHRGKDLPFRALANDTYDESLAFARAHPVAAGLGDKLTNTASLSRFAFAAARADAFKPGTAKQDLDYAFDTLQQVCQGDFTVWRIVYDISEKKIHFRTQNNPEPRVLDFKTLDFSCGRPVQFADIQAKPGAGGALEFQELTEPLHRKYLEGFYAQASLKQLLGDLSPRIDGVLLTLRTYTCAP